MECDSAAAIKLCADGVCSRGGGAGELSNISIAMQIRVVNRIARWFYFIFHVSLMGI